MYCMIALNQIKPGQRDAVVKGLERDFVPILKKTPGFRSVYMVAGPKGEYTGFVLWDNRASGEAYANSPGRKKALAGVADLFEGPMKLQFSEVLVSATA
jgi:heme-degrading monooxygenase HmoA